MIVKAALLGTSQTTRGISAMGSSTQKHPFSKPKMSLPPERRQYYPLLTCPAQYPDMRLSQAASRNVS